MGIDVKFLNITATNKKMRLPSRQHTTWSVSSWKARHPHNRPLQQFTRSNTTRSQHSRVLGEFSSLNKKPTWKLSEIFESHSYEQKTISEVDETVSQEQLNKISKLARIYIKDEENEKIRKQINEIMQCLNQIQNINTQDVQPMSSPIDEIETLNSRDDIVENTSEISKQILSQAPEKKDSFFVVPKMLGNRET